MIYLLIANGVALLVLGSGVYALYRLQWLDRFHHLWFVFAAFTFTPTTSVLDIVVRSLALLIACDDAVQHVVQWHQWATRRTAVQGLYQTAPDEGTGWPGIYRSMLHRLYGWFLTLWERL